MSDIIKTIVAALLLIWPAAGVAAESNAQKSPAREGVNTFKDSLDLDTTGKAVGAALVAGAVTGATAVATKSPTLAAAAGAAAGAVYLATHEGVNKVIETAIDNHFDRKDQELANKSDVTIIKFDGTRIEPKNDQAKDE